MSPEILDALNNFGVFHILYLLKSLLHQNLAKSELDSTHDRNGIINKNKLIQGLSYGGGLFLGLAKSMY